MRDSEITNNNTVDFTSFQKNADFLWNCVLFKLNKRSGDQQEFISALKVCTDFLEKLNMDQVKDLCRIDGMAEKISMIVDLKDYVYNSMIDEWQNIFTDL